MRALKSVVEAAELLRISPWTVRNSCAGATTLAPNGNGKLIPGVPPTKFPFYSDTGTGSGLGGLLKTTPLGRSFFDVATTIGGTWDVNQGSDFITVLGGIHPILGAGIQDPGNLALWAYATGM